MAVVDIDTIKPMTLKTQLVQPNCAKYCDQHNSTSLDTDDLGHAHSHITSSESTWQYEHLILGITQPTFTQDGG